MNRVLVNGIKVILFGPVFAVLGSLWIKVIQVNPHTLFRDLSVIEKMTLVGGIFICGLISGLLSVLIVNFF
jgi:hypothetical protein